MTFLVLTDFTPDADRALEYAAVVATRTGASLVLLHIRRESLLDPEAFTGKIRNMSEGEIAAAFAQRTANMQAPVVVETTADGIGTAVRNAAARHGATLVVLGKPATNASPDELVSSLSLNLLRATSVPLLVVPIGSAAVEPPQQLVLALDGQPFQLGEPVQAATQQLLQGLAATLTVVQVAAPDTDDDPAPALATVARSGLTAGLPAPRSYRIRHSSPAGGIVQAVHDTNADAVVLVARRRSFLGSLFNSSVSAQVILHSPVPVLLLPE